MQTSSDVIRGKVVFFHDGPGWGYIQRFDGQPDVYVWHKDISEAPGRYPGDRRVNLAEGQIVEFRVEERERGPRAVDVKVVRQ